MDKPAKTAEMPNMEPVPGVDFPITTAIPKYKDIAYANVSPSQKLDLYMPDGSGPFPLVIMVHGGAFSFGDKSDGISRAGTDELLLRGYAIANVNYRLSGDAKAPAQIQDIKTAVRWLRAHADNYDLDSGRFGAWGASAGGNLVALLGTSKGVAALEGAELGWNEQSSQVQAVVDWFGPIDFLKMDRDYFWKPRLQTHNAPDSPESALIGAPIKTRQDLVKLVNPLTYISKESAPFLIQHGTKDDLVPIQQSKRLYAALKSAIGQDNVTLTLLPGASHGGGPQFWDFRNMQKVISFFDKYLRVESARERQTEEKRLLLDETHQADLASGSFRIFRDSLYFYGAFHPLTLDENDRGRTLKISVDTQNRQLCWIELWPGSYDENDVFKWRTRSGLKAVVRSGAGLQANPYITWTIEPGDYTVYFGTYSITGEIKHVMISYHIKVT